MTSVEEHHELREFINDKFNAHEDLEAYPATLESDLKQLEKIVLNY